MQRLLPKEHIYETETDSDIDLWGPRGGGGGRDGLGVGISRCKLLYREGIDHRPYCRA